MDAPIVAAIITGSITVVGFVLHGWFLDTRLENQKRDNAEDLALKVEEIKKANAESLALKVGESKC
jgi:hypothetical protein